MSRLAFIAENACGKENVAQMRVALLLGFLLLYWKRIYVSGFGGSNKGFSWQHQFCGTRSH
jgi:hypothetical protein